MSVQSQDQSAPDGWGPSFTGFDPWFQGTAGTGAQDVPSLLPISIGDHSYVVDAAKYERSTIEALRPGVDQAPEPGEVSLNNKGLWPRSQSDWRLGANQLMFDENDSKRQRFWQSKGLNPHPDFPANAYQLRLHKDVQQIASSANSNLDLLPAGIYLYRVDGTEMYWTTALAGGGTVWTAAGFNAAAGSQILATAFDGAYVYAATGAGGLYRSAIGSTVAQRFNAAAQTISQVAYANGNLFAAQGPTIWQMNAQGQKDGDTVGIIGYLTVASGTGANPTLQITAAAFGVANLANVTLVSGAHTQSFTANGAVTAGAVTMPITGTPSFNYPIGTPVIAVVATGAATGLLAFTHPNPSFVWQKALSTPHGIFVTGNSGISGEMYRMDTDTTTGALIPPESMFILPNGEALNDMTYYSGALILGTSRGVRVAVVQVSFVISATYGPVILIPGGVNKVFGYGEFGWFTWSNYDNVSTGLGRLDLARFAADETPAMSSDIMVGTTAAPVQGTVTGVCNFANVPCLAISGAGFWSEHPTNYVQSAFLDVGRIKFGTTEKKLPVYIDLYHDPLPAGASITVQVVDEFGVVHAGGTSGAQSSIHPSPLLAINESAPSEQLDLQIIINNGSDLTNPPVLRRWTLYALVTPRRVDQIQCPIIMHRAVTLPSDEGGDQYFDTLAEWQYLKDLEATGTPVVYKEGDNVETVYVDLVDVKGEQWDPIDHHWLEGIVTVTLITIGLAVSP